MANGLQTSYDFSTGVKINMDEAIYMLSPLDTPLLTGVGTNGNTVLPSMPVDETRFYWMDEEALLPRSTLAAAAATTDAFITVQGNDHLLRFSTGDMLVVHKAGSTERMRVTGYGTTADTLTVTRAYAGTATNYGIGAEVVALGTALPEGSAAEDGRSLDRDQYYNLTQIFGPTRVSITRTEQTRSKYGVADEFAHQLFLRIKEATIAREQAYLYGVRTESTVTKIRTTGGIDYFLTSNVDATSTALTVAKIEANMLNCYDAGAVPDQLWVNPRATADLNSAQDSLVRVTNVETRRGNMPVQLVTTEYGDVQIVRNRWIYKANAFGVNRDAVTRRVFTPMITEKLAKVADREDWHFLCEEGLEVKGEQHCMKFTALNY